MENVKNLFKKNKPTKEEKYSNYFTAIEGVLNGGQWRRDHWTAPQVGIRRNSDRIQLMRKGSSLSDAKPQAYNPTYTDIVSKDWVFVGKNPSKKDKELKKLTLEQRAITFI